MEEKKKPLRKRLVYPLHCLKYRLYYYGLALRNLLFAERHVDDCKQIPIIINNYNRLTFLRDLIGCLERRGYRNLYIIDNHSTYPPLLEYYKTLPYKIFHLDRNLGYRAFILAGIYKQFKNRFFVYTDSDIYLPDCCPDDFLKHFYDILVNTPYTAKVGCALRIDDLPDFYVRKNDVLQWERHFWEKPLGDDQYLADIDTTFALHKPNLRIGHRATGHRIRVAGPYACQHRPWYVDSAHLDPEEQYYLDSVARPTWWTQPDKKAVSN